MNETVVVAADLHDLPDDSMWCRWPHWDGLVRRLDRTRFVAVVPFIYTRAIIVGSIGDTTGYADRWCFHTTEAALIAATVWDGTGEPEGWHRHPLSGRRRVDGDAATEYINR